MIYHAKDPRLPQFQFEWHPLTEKVYRVDVPGEWRDRTYHPSSQEVIAKGYCIAEHCKDGGQFHGFVQTFCRGYLLAVKHSLEGILEHNCPERVLNKEGDPCPIR